MEYIPSGTLINCPSDQGVYYVQSGVRKPIATQNIFNALFGGRTVWTISDADFSSIPLGSGGYAGFPDGTLLVAQNSATYAMENGVRRAIPSQGSYDALFDHPGTLRGQFIHFTDTDFSHIPEGLPLPRIEAGQVVAPNQIPSGTLINCPSDQGVYYVQSGVRKPIATQNIFNALFGGRTVWTISDADFNSIPLDAAGYRALADGTLLVFTGNQMYVMESGLRRPIPTPSSYYYYFDHPGTLFNQLNYFNDTDAGHLPVGHSIPRIESGQTPGSLWLHVSVFHNWEGNQAGAGAWTTISQDPRSAPVNVGSIRLKLDWESSQENTVYGTFTNQVTQSFIPFYVGGATATAWVTGPDMGPLVAST